MRSRKITIAALGLVLAVAVGAGGTYYAMSGGHGMMGHHARGMQHDETNMPGLQGVNATPEESAELSVLFRNFETITRELENLPDGIRAVTGSSQPDVMDALVSHVVGMIDRVDQLDDPKIRIQSPTLDILFVRGQELPLTSTLPMTES